MTQTNLNLAPALMGGLDASPKQRPVRKPEQNRSAGLRFLERRIRREPEWTLTRIRALETTLKYCLTDPDLLTPAQQAGDPERYRRHLLYSQPEPGVSLLALVWEPGQGTAIHAHAAHGLVGVFAGELEETRYARVDGAAGPATGRPLVPGDTSIVLARSDIHRLANHGPGRAISLHLYFMDLSDDPTRINLPVLPAAR